MKIRRILVKCIGILFLAVGLVSLFAFPAEFTSFYSFSIGGKYYYEGFGFGSLLFTIILFWTLLYAVLALICIPVGLGNLKSAYWGYKLSRILFMTVTAIGCSLVMCVILSFRRLESFTDLQYIAIMLMPVLLLIVLPQLLLSFYQNRKTQQIFMPSRNTFFENQSEQKMVIVLLNLVWVIAFFIMIFLKGSFPFVGRFIFAKQGTYLLSLLIFAMLILSYMYYRNIRLTKYIMLALYAFLVFSFVITFAIVPGKEFISLLGLPTYEKQEMASLLNIISGVNAGYFYGTILIIQTILLLLHKAHKDAGG